MLTSYDLWLAAIACSDRAEKMLHESRKNTLHPHVAERFRKEVDDVRELQTKLNRAARRRSKVEGILAWRLRRRR